MNPDAKEFVPAHILKRRQEEAERLSNLTDQMSKVNLKKSDKESSENGTKVTMKNDDELNNQNPSNAHNNNIKKFTGTPAKNDVGADSHCTRPVGGEAKQTTPTSSGHDSRSKQPHTKDPATSSQFDNYDEEYYGDENYPEVDDKDLLREGENLCEFNGEEFIIPGDDDCVPSTQAGYDFGNDEDNEDEDVCNAFEEFLGNLPN